MSTREQLKAKFVQGYKLTSNDYTDWLDATSFVSDTPTYVAIIDGTYSEILSLATSGALVPDQRYKITDFSSDYVFDGGGSETKNYTSTTEPIIVTARDANTLYQDITSELFPDDIIRYDLISDVINGTYTKGKITFRHTPMYDITTPFDWRTYKTRLWETTLGSGMFLVGDGQGSGKASQMFPIFDTINQTLGFDIQNIRIADTKGYHIPIVFKSGVKKIDYGPAGDALVIGGFASDIVVGTCSTVTINGNASALGIENGTVTSFGNIVNTSFGMGVNCSFTGDLNNCQVMSGFYDGGVPITGDHDNKTIGYPPKHVKVNLSSYGLGIVPTETFATYALYDIWNTTYPNTVNTWVQITSNENETNELGWLWYSITGGRTWVSSLTYGNITLPPYLVGSQKENLCELSGVINFPTSIIPLAGNDQLAYVKLGMVEADYSIGDTVTIIQQSGQDPLMVNCGNPYDRKNLTEEFTCQLGYGIRLNNNLPMTWTKVDAGGDPNRWTISSNDTLAQTSGYSGWGNGIEPNSLGVRQRYSLNETQYKALSAEVGSVKRVSTDTVIEGYTDSSGSTVYYDNQTIIATTGCNKLVINSGGFQFGSRVRIINEQNPIIEFNSGVINTTNITYNTVTGAGIRTSDGVHIINYNSTDITWYIQMQNDDRGDTIELEYNGDGIWRWQVFDFTSWLEGQQPWSSISKVGATASEVNALPKISLNVYENNSAAISGGLTVGSTYRTSTGVLMIVY